MSRKYQKENRLNNMNDSPSKRFRLDSGSSRRGDHSHQFGGGGGGGGGPSYGRYGEHDDRGRRSPYDGRDDDGTRPYRPRGLRGGRGSQRIEVTMDSDLRLKLIRNRSQSVPGGRGNRGGRIDRGGASKAREPPREEVSYRVTIPNVDTYDQQYLMNLLRENLSEQNVVFYQFQLKPDLATFFILGDKLAYQLRQLSRCITTKNGQQLVILTRVEALPNPPLNQQNEKIIKASMLRLYDPMSRVLDLSDFRNAQEFKQEGLYIAIGRISTMKIIVNIITNEYYGPEMLALNMRGNTINYLEPLRSLAEKCHSLKAVDLSKNRIRSFDELKNLEGLDLLELILDGNPFIESDFNSTAAYISAVRKLFKNLKRLDNKNLPDEIGFDMGVISYVPASQPHFIPQALDAFVKAFLEGYYRIFDSMDRKGLIDAYRTEAVFTYSYGRNRDHDLHQPSIAIDPMIQESHNLRRLRESDWVKKIQTNNIDIVSFLSKFPVTKHDPASFHIDVPMFEPTFVIIVVNGLFEETLNTNGGLRAFCRTFLMVPEAAPHGETSGKIVNDMLQVANPTAMQSLDYRNQKAQRAQVSLKGGGNQSEPMMADHPSPADPSQELILQQFMQATKMNREYSLKCLVENNFEPEKAWAIFKRLHEGNGIPAAAFQP